ncbi:MAG: carotenoid 1,2-hydratase [Gammaproteobacteria bacterium]|nr:carotenoid 1,2-hydratase [Gammaproteobacteria bacterium]
MNKLYWLLTVAGALLWAALSGVHGGPAPRDGAHDNAIAAMSAPTDDAGFARAEQPRVFEFPRDHAAHPEFRSEWWYFTGHLKDSEGRPFGFQLTLFRFELAAHTPPSASAWRSSRVLLGHFAITDIEGQQFHAYERMSRALPEVAGVSVAPPAVWLDDWRIEYDAATGWHLKATQQGQGIDLKLDEKSAVVLQGDEGLSRKSAAPGNASYYYSLPRLAARGTLTLADSEHAVSGEAWLDREWSTSALSRQQAGWDWFALQLADGGSLMFYRLRQRDGGSDAFSAGTYVDSAGRPHRLAAEDVRISTLGAWKSARTGRTYPQGWRLDIPAHQLTLTLAPRLADQEWHGRFKYWEGAVTVSREGQPAGLGYVEMTGY